MQGISALNSSGLSSPLSSSLAGDPSVDSRFTQTGVQSDDVDELGLANGDIVFRELTDGTIGKMETLPSSQKIYSREVQSDLGGAVACMGGTYVSNSVLNDQMQNMEPVELGDSVYEKPATIDGSLQHMLSDTISGLLMEDAMVAQCGHSFGRSGLLQVIETNLCLSCGAPVPSDSLIPNHGLRAAVLAYKKEGARRKKDLSVQADSINGKKSSRALADFDVSRPKGVQFPFVANDRVLIKGNKRTPVRFVGREAVITTQCLNGWYLVKTLDNGESVRLQYRSLQRVGDMETQTELKARISNGKLNGGALNTDCLKVRMFPTYSAADGKECSPCYSHGKIGGISFPSGITKGMRSEYFSRTNCGRQRANHTRFADASGASWQSGRISGNTSSNSSQDLQGEQVKKVLELRNLQVHGKGAQKAVPMYDSTEEDIRATKRIAAIGSTGDVVQGSALHAGCFVHEHKALREGVDGASLKESKKVEASREHNVGRDFYGAKIQGKISRPRPKHNSVQAHISISARSDSQEADPYKKVYVSGCRRRASGVDGHGSMSFKQSAFASLNMDTGHGISLPFGEQPHKAEVKTSGESNISQIAASSFEMIKKGMLDLETEIPWSCMHDDWKTIHVDWRAMLQESSTIKDVANRLHELRRALFLEKAGNMTNKEWTEKLEAALELEELDVVAQLWERLREDICKLIESKLKRDSRKPSSNIKPEFLELKNLFPHLCIGGLSRMGIIAAASMAAAESYAFGEEDMEALLAVPMKLVQEHSKQELLALIDVLEREKRHLSAKVSNLGAGGNSEGTRQGPDEEPTRFSRKLSHITCTGFVDESPLLGEAKGDVVRMAEETDVSDSDE